MKGTWERKRERRETGEDRENEGDIQGKKERENEGGKKGEGDSPLSMSGLRFIA